MSKELTQGLFNFRLFIILICNALTTVAKEDTKLTQPSCGLWEVYYFRQISRGASKTARSEKRGRQQQKKNLETPGLFRAFRWWGRRKEIWARQTARWAHFAWRAKKKEYLLVVYNPRQKILETLMHVPFPLQCWEVIAKFRGYNNIAKRGEETKVNKIFQSVSRFLSEIVALTVKKLTCFWWTRTRKIDAPFILWWPNNVWCYDNRNVTCIHFVHFTIFREFTKKLDQVPNEGENKKKTVRIIFENQASRK